MSRRFWTSDWHFGHKYVSELRGFASVEEHDAAIIANVNAMMGKNDMGWCLGDTGLARDAYVLERVKQLNGTWHLIAGNHDPCWPGRKHSYGAQRKWLEVFASVQAFATTRIGVHEVLMSHFPYLTDYTPTPRAMQFRLRDEGGILLAGHTHSAGKWHGPRQINVGLEAWDLKPVTEAQILELLGSLAKDQKQPVDRR